VVATSITAAVAYLPKDLTNLRLGMTLETFTVVGALAGGLVGAILSRGVLSGIFGGVMVIVSIYLLVRPRGAGTVAEAGDLWAPWGACYHDLSLGRTVRYRVRRLPVGLGASLVAGAVSGLLGWEAAFSKSP